MSYAILIELPLVIKQELLRFCFGLPTAEWQTEENFYISLCTFTKLTDIEHWDIVDQLGEIDVKAFSINVHRINYSPKRGNVGTLWAAVEPSSELDILRKKLDNQLRPFNQHNHKNNHQSYPSILLGTVHKESPERLAHYFEANSEIPSSSFEVHDFVLAQMHQTNKRSFYTVEKRYFLSKMN